MEQQELTVFGVDLNVNGFLTKGQSSMFNINIKHNIAIAQKHFSNF